MFVYTFEHVFGFLFLAAAVLFWLVSFIFVKFDQWFKPRKPYNGIRLSPLHNEPDTDEVEREFLEYAKKPRDRDVCTLCGSDTTEEQSTPDKSGYSVPLYWCDHCDRYVETVVV